MTAPAGQAILLVGHGKMGGAMVRGWLAAGTGPITVVEPSPATTRAVAWFADAGALPTDLAPAAIVLAVKPQVMDAVAPRYIDLARRSGAVVVSIAAGRTIAGFKRVFGADAPIVRAMPNLPASIGHGITAAVASAEVDADARALADRLLGACGPVAWLADEASLDPVTALSGGGPAYVFLLVEMLAAAGARLGLDPALAGRLARATVAGSGALLDADPTEAAALRAAVTSPGGTTQAALAVLMGEDGCQPLFDRALAAATARARELAG